MKLSLRHIISLGVLLLTPALHGAEPVASEPDADIVVVEEVAETDSAAVYSTTEIPADIPAATTESEKSFDKWDYDSWEERDVAFNPDATRAVWMSALFPGLGQLYNRRYWKLPIVVGAYVGLGYATSWNNSMLRDYTRAYRDLTDNDETTKSYMDFFPPTTTEDSLDRSWLTNIMRARKDFYRRNRDLCIISMVGVYLLAMVDAYVDASLSHFDITPDLAIDIQPQLMIDDPHHHRPGIGLLWALTF